MLTSGREKDYEGTEVAIKLHGAKLCRAHKALQIVRLPEGNSISVQRNKQRHTKKLKRQGRIFIFYIYIVAAVVVVVVFFFFKLPWYRKTTYLYRKRLLKTTRLG